MKKVVLCLLFIFISFTVHTEENVRLFDTVHFKGLQTLTKYDIAKKSGMKSHNERIAVDLDRLKSVLSREAVIKSYKLIDKKNILTIVVTEYTPEYTVYITGRHTNIFCEADTEFNIISTKTLHVLKLPVIVIDVSAVDDKKIKEEHQARIRFVMGLLKKSSLFDQMKQVDFSTTGVIGVNLNGRRTTFLLSSHRPEVDRLKSAAGYLDSIDRYPRTLDVRGRMAVIR